MNEQHTEQKQCRLNLCAYNCLRATVWLTNELTVLLAYFMFSTSLNSKQFKNISISWLAINQSIIQSINRLLNKESTHIASDVGDKTPSSNKTVEPVLNCFRKAFRDGVCIQWRTKDDLALDQLRPYDQQRTIWFVLKVNKYVWKQTENADENTIT